MAEIHETLTDLVVEALKINQPERDPISFYIGDKARAAINTAEDQIKQQQRERVEKSEKAARLDELKKMGLYLVSAQARQN